MPEVRLTSRRRGLTVTSGDILIWMSVRTAALSAFRHGLPPPLMEVQEDDTNPSHRTLQVSRNVAALSHASNTARRWRLSSGCGCVQHDYTTAVSKISDAANENTYHTTLPNLMQTSNAALHVSIFQQLCVDCKQATRVTQTTREHGPQ